MKYKEPQILIEVRRIKEQLHAKMEAEGEDAFFARINRGATNPRSAPKRALARRGNS